jgi:hypothetical protein
MPGEFYSVDCRRQAPLVAFRCYISQSCNMDSKARTLPGSDEGSKRSAKCPGVSLGALYESKHDYQHDGAHGGSNELPDQAARGHSK